MKKNLQKKYIEILEDLRKNKTSLEDDDNTLKSIIIRSNVLFRDVENTSEMNLDAKVIIETNRLNAAKLDKNSRNRELTTEKFIEIMKEGGPAEEKFARAVFERSRGVKIFKSTPFGVIEGKKERKKAVKKIIEEITEESAVKIGNYKDSQTDFMTKEISKIKTVIEKHKSIEFFRLVIDPKSFSNTIQNIFHLSFVFKTGYVNMVSKNNAIFVEKNFYSNFNENFEKRELNNKENLKKKAKTVKKEVEEIDLGEINTDREHFIFNIDYEEYLQIVKNLKIDDKMIN